MEKRLKFRYYEETIAASCLVFGAVMIPLMMEVFYN